MDNFEFPNGWFVLVRSVHISACLLLFAIAIFGRWIGSPAVGSGRWGLFSRRSNFVLLPIVLASAIAWLILVASDITGVELIQATHWKVLRIVCFQTHFGRLWQLRMLIWIGACACAVCRSNWILLFCTAALLCSLAWAGHGQDGTPAWGHLLADAVHLLIAGIWPGGLLPFAGCLFTLRREKSVDAIIVMTRRFSATSLASVSLLTITGLINSGYLLGSISSVTHSSYGWLLLAKIGVFFVMICFGAHNLLRLKPRMDKQAAGILQRNVIVELILAIVVVVIVAILGLLAPMRM